MKWPLCLWLKVDKLTSSIHKKINAFFLYFLQQATFNDQAFHERVDRRDRKLNGSTRSMASTHPMLATSTSAPGMGGHHYGLGGQSPVRESFRHHLSAEATSLTSKVHTVILTGKFYNSLIHSTGQGTKIGPHSPEIFHLLKWLKMLWNVILNHFCGWTFLEEVGPILVLHSVCRKKEILEKNSCLDKEGICNF